MLLFFMVVYSIQEGWQNIYLCKLIGFGFNGNDIVGLENSGLWNFCGWIDQIKSGWMDLLTARIYYLLFMCMF